MASTLSRSPARPAVTPQFAAGERFLTVGIVAEYFGVTEVTIKNWVDAGQLLAARTVGGHRRIAASSVAKLLEAQGRPVPTALARRKPLVVLLDSDAAFVRTMKRTLAARSRVESESDLYAGLLMIARLRPEVIVLDLHLPHVDARKILTALRTDPNTKVVDLVAVGTTTGDAKLVQQLQPASAPPRGSGSLAFFRRSEAGALVDAVHQRIDRPPPMPRARRR